MKKLCILLFSISIITYCVAKQDLTLQIELTKLGPYDVHKTVN